MSQTNRYIAQKVRLSRIESGLSLRELAQKVQLSHSYVNRIEKGGIAPSKKVLEKLQKTLEFEVQTHPQCEANFKPKFEALLRKIVYAHFAEARPIAETLFKDRIIYENCICHAEYYLDLTLYILYMERFGRLAQRFGVFAPFMPELLDTYMSKLIILSQSLSGQNKVLYAITHAMDCMRKNQDQKALSLLMQNIKKATNNNLLGMNYYLIAEIYRKNYEQQHQALDISFQAQECFLSTNNYNRLMMVKTQLQSLYLNMNRFDQFMSIYREQYNYAVINGFVSVYISTQINLMKYHIIHHQYQEALTVGKTLKIIHIIEYFALTAYAAFKLKKYEKAIHAIEQGEKILDPRDQTFTTCMVALRTLIEPAHNTSERRKRLKDFADSAAKSNNTIIMRIAFQLYEEQLIANKRYKEALYYKDLMLSFTKTMARGGNDYEALSKRTVV